MAGEIFAQKYGWKNWGKVYCTSTKNVLKALQEGEVEYGVFAWASQRGGLVEETKEAIQHFSFHKKDEVTISIHHAIFCNGEIDLKKTVLVYSHPQALKEHAPSLLKIFPHHQAYTEEDTALAAEKLQKGVYPNNSVVIAPIACQKIYPLSVFLPDIPTNEGYRTTFWLVGEE